MLINFPELESNLNYSDLEASVEHVAAQGTWLKLDGFGDAGHQLRKSCTPPQPFLPRRPLATPGTLSHCAEWHQLARQCLWHAHFSQCGCHRLDKFLLPNLRIENGEFLAR